MDELRLFVSQVMLFVSLSRIYSQSWGTEEAPPIRQCFCSPFADPKLGPSKIEKWKRARSLLRARGHVDTLCWWGRFGKRFFGSFEWSLFEKLIPGSLWRSAWCDCESSFALAVPLFCRSLDTLCWWGLLGKHFFRRFEWSLFEKLIPGSLWRSAWCDCESRFALAVILFCRSLDTLCWWGRFGKHFFGSFEWSLLGNFISGSLWRSAWCDCESSFALAVTLFCRSLDTLCWWGRFGKRFFGSFEWSLFGNFISGSLWRSAWCDCESRFGLAVTLFCRSLDTLCWWVLLGKHFFRRFEWSLFEKLIPGSLWRSARCDCESRFALAVILFCRSLDTLCWWGRFGKRFLEGLNEACWETSFLDRFEEVFDVIMKAVLL